LTSTSSNSTVAHQRQHRVAQNNYFIPRSPNQQRLAANQSRPLNAYYISLDERIEADSTGVFGLHCRPAVVVILMDFLNRAMKNLGKAESLQKAVGQGVLHRRTGWPRRETDWSGAFHRVLKRTCSMCATQLVGRQWASFCIGHRGSHQTAAKLPSIARHAAARTLVDEGFPGARRRLVALILQGRINLRTRFGGYVVAIQR
jgi:hypothetical protein